MTQSRYEQLAQNPQTTSYLTQATLRDILLPLILGTENDAISYWAGKQLALQFPLASREDLSRFFVQMNFGDLRLKKQKKEQFFFELTGPVVVARIADFETPDFQLEAGFIAQSMEQQLQHVTEAKATIENKKTVTIFVQTDSNAPIESEPMAAIHLTTDLAQVAIVPNQPATNPKNDQSAVPFDRSEPVQEPPFVPEADEPKIPLPPETTTHNTRTRVTDLPSRREMHRKHK
ncbi:YslB family protein [Latilactobacillus graminis]|uniref:DUF2507 domain-containing protein n=1 Tax=Latilactobacillus graminis DSM 20719 TaxID=1423752 RepID=A0AA89I2D8_9LACO|nr:YslB family protein [Latilactobacillus graminis]KRM24408.1 hypothetical protein FC90_GL000549 [Latilactobacillus graminis DSM 20719]